MVYIVRDGSNVAKRGNDLMPVGDLKFLNLENFIRSSFFYLIVKS